MFPNSGRFLASACSLHFFAAHEAYSEKYIYSLASQLAALVLVIIRERPRASVGKLVLTSYFRSQVLFAFTSEATFIFLYPEEKII